MRILFASGGTGGHIMPVISVKQELDKIAEEQGFKINYLFVGHIDDIGVRILEENNIPFKRIYAGKLRRYMSIDNFTDIFKAIQGLTLAQWYVWKYMPDVTFGKGGYASVPAVLVSWLYQIPVLIHESDVLPGLANKFLSKFATAIAVAFPRAKDKFPSKKTSLVGNMTHLDIRLGSRDEAKRIFKVTYEKPILLVIGGSQGAKKMNEVVWKIIPQLTEFVEVIHVVGDAHVRTASKVYRSLNTYQSRFYHYTGFLTHDLKHAYAAADLVLSRAGASSIADICLTKKPSILVPITVDAGQQRENAYQMAEIGASVVLEEPNLTVNMILSKVEELIKQPYLLNKMGDRADAFATPDAARRVADEILEILN